MEWKKLVDRTLGTNFDAPQYDPRKGRDKLVKAIDTAAKQHTDGSTKAPNRAWKLGGNNAIRFIPKLNGNELLLDDNHPVFVPAEQFQNFLKDLKSSVQAGHLDEQIKAALEGKASSASMSSSIKGAGTPRQSGIPARADGLPHRVKASEPQPHADYQLNKLKTHWRSPEQVAKDAASYADRSAKK
jgi:hypothetical protein